MLRFVHVSDIHFGQETAGQKVPYRDVRKQLLDDVRKLRQDRGPCSGILAAGDIAYGGTDKNYSEASEWFDQLCEAAQCEHSAVCVVPGNHDVNWGSISGVARLIHDSIRKNPSNSQETLAIIADEHPVDNPLLRPQYSYQKFAEQYGCPFESSSQPLWRKYFKLREGNYLCVIGMNSAQISNKGDRKGDLLLGNRQYTIDDAPDGIAQVVMMHHPFAWLMDGQQAWQVLHDRTRIFITGHEHEAAIEKKITSRNVEVIMLASGAVTPDDSGTQAKFAYNWLEFEVHEDASGHRLALEAIPRVWRLENRRFGLDTAIILERSESVTFDIPCPNFARAASLEVGDVMSVDTTSEKDFESLRLAFWRLDDSERLATLLKLKLLPKNFNGTLTLTLERVALNKARNSGKLSDLWNAVSKVSSELSADSNPFERTSA